MTGVQDSCRSEVIDSDWKPLVTQAKTMLEGFTGRMTGCRSVRRMAR
jgi:hypothetical protein